MLNETEKYEAKIKCAKSTKLAMSDERNYANIIYGDGVGDLQPYEIKRHFAVLETETHDVKSIFYIPNFK